MIVAKALRISCRLACAKRKARMQRQALARWSQVVQVRTRQAVALARHARRWRWTRLKAHFGLWRAVVQQLLEARGRVRRCIGGKRIAERAFKLWYSSHLEDCASQVREVPRSDCSDRVLGATSAFVGCRPAHGGNDLRSRLRFGACRDPRAPPCTPGFLRTRLWQFCLRHADLQCRSWVRPCCFIHLSRCCPLKRVRCCQLERGSRAGTGSGPGIETRGRVHVQLQLLA